MVPTLDQTALPLDCQPASPCGDRGEVLARLEFLVARNYRLGLLLGDRHENAILLRAFTAARGRRIDAAQLSAAVLTSAELVRKLADRLGLRLSHAAGTWRYWRAVSDRIEVARHEGRRLALLLEDVDEAPAPAQFAIAGLVTAATARELPLTVVLAARRSGASRLEPHLVELVDLRIDPAPAD